MTQTRIGALEVVPNVPMGLDLATLRVGQKLQHETDTQNLEKDTQKNTTCFRTLHLLFTRNGEKSPPYPRSEPCACDPRRAPGGMPRHPVTECLSALTFYLRWYSSNKWRVPLIGGGWLTLERKYISSASNSHFDLFLILRSTVRTADVQSSVPPQYCTIQTQLRSHGSTYSSPSIA